MDSSNPMPNKSTGVPMMYDKDTGVRQQYVDDRELYAVPLFFDSADKKGAYQAFPYAFDEIMNPAKESMLYWTTFHYVLTLVSQNVGTPFLKQGLLANPDLKHSDYQKMLSKAKNYEDNNNIFRSTYFRASVSERIAQIQSIPFSSPEFKDEDNNLTIDKEIYEGYEREGGSIFMLNAKLGAYGNTPRAKFDIIFMPLYRHPEKKDYDDREIFGFIALFILFDPLWDMREALQVFVHQYNNWLLGVKGHVEFNADPRILPAFHKDKYMRFYEDHFKNYIKIDPQLSQEVESKGIDLNPENTNKLSRFLQFRIALNHAAQYGGYSHDSNWYRTYESIIEDKRGWLTFKPIHDPYIYNYHNFLWNSKNQFSMAARDEFPDGIGIFHEYFPWVTLHKRILSSELVGFERIHSSLLADLNKEVDAMDIDGPSAPQLNQIYTDTYEKLMNINTNKEDSFIHSEHNGIVAIAERARNDLQTLQKNIETYRTSNPNMEKWLFPQSEEGLMSLTPEQVDYVNKSLEELEVHNAKLRSLQQRLLRFVTKRIFTLATTKPLTPSILATIQYIYGKTLKTKLPGDNQSTLDVNDAIPLEKRNLSQYQLKMIDPTLDITAHGAMYFVTSTRYFGYNAFCTFDAYKLQVGLMDAFRSEFNMHWNFGSFGPFGTSKSRALEVFKANCLPQVVTNVTTQSLLANAACKDMSDRIRIMDEASALLSTNSKGGSASYSPEAAAIKSEMTTGYSERHVLDVGKNFAERTTRHIISIQIGCIAACSNILITDQALMSRFHTTITENETDRQKAKSKSKSSSSASGNTAEEILERQNRERNRVNISDMILHTPSDMTKKTGKFFEESMQMQQCMGILIWKFIQMGILRRPSTHIVCVVAIICKNLKTTLNISIPVRTVQRIILFAMNLAVITAINTLFNTPGIHEELHNIPFKFDMLLQSAPYLYVTLQMVLLSFSMHSCEFLKHTDNLILEGIVENLKIKMFPTQRINALFKHRNIERIKKDNPLYATINTIDKTDLSLVEKDPLWPSFRDMDSVPLEFLYVEDQGVNALSTFWRTNLLPGTQREAAAAPKPKKINAAMILMGGAAVPNPQPQQGGGENAGNANGEEGPSVADATTLVDLAYWTTGLTRPQLLDLLQRHFKGRINADQVASSLQDIETTKLTVRTILPLTKKDLKDYQRLYYKAVEEKTPLPTLPRFEREMNCMETDHNQHICVCAFMFGELLNRPGNNNVIMQAIKSFVYKGLKPRTLLTGSELSDNYDIEFSMHSLRAEEIKQASEKYLRITDPSLINASMESQNRGMVEKIANTMRDLASARDKIYDKTMDMISTQPLNVTQRRGRVSKVNSMVIQLESHTIGKNLDTLERETANLSFNELVNEVRVESGDRESSNQPMVEVLNAATGGPATTQEGHQRIYGDIDEWAFVNNCLDNGLPLRIDPAKRVYLFKASSEDTEWKPIHTPLQLIEYHKKAQHSQFTETMLHASVSQSVVAPNATTANNGNNDRDTGFTEFLQSVSAASSQAASQKRQRDDAEAVEHEPSQKKARKNTPTTTTITTNRRNVKAAIFAGNLNPVVEDSRTLGEPEEDIYNNNMDTSS